MNCFAHAGFVSESNTPATVENSDDALTPLFAGLSESNKFAELVPMQQYPEIDENIPSIEDLSQTWATDLAQSSTTAEYDPEADVINIEEEHSVNTQHVESCPDATTALKWLKGIKHFALTKDHGELLEICMNGEDILANILSNKKCHQTCITDYFHKG